MEHLRAWLSLRQLDYSMKSVAAAAGKRKRAYCQAHSWPWGTAGFWHQCLPTRIVACQFDLVLFSILQLRILLKVTYLNILEAVLFSPHKQILNIQMNFCMNTCLQIKVQFDMGLFHHDGFTYFYPHDVPFYYSPRSDCGWEGTPGRTELSLGQWFAWWIHEHCKCFLMNKKA